MDKTETLLCDSSRGVPSGLTTVRAGLLMLGSNRCAGDGCA